MTLSMPDREKSLDGHIIATDYILFSVFAPIFGDFLTSKTAENHVKRKTFSRKCYFLEEFHRVFKIYFVDNHIKMIYFQKKIIFYRKKSSICFVIKKNDVPLQSFFEGKLKPSEKAK